MGLEGLEKRVEALDMVGVVACELFDAGVGQALAQDVNEAAIDQRRIRPFGHEGRQRNPSEVVDR
ncbi:MAG: hypothetical protein LC798_07915, partial [Chloroflexi bacterium]|nr:hypothetical protein [Chloroflexota bacterium]